MQSLVRVTQQCTLPYPTHAAVCSSYPGLVTSALRQQAAGIAAWLSTWHGKQGNQQQQAY